MDRRGFLERLGVATAGAVASAATGGAAGAAIMPALDADRLFLAPADPRACGRSELDWCVTPARLNAVVASL